MADHCAVHAMDHLVLSVASIERSLAFYTQVLGMKAEVFHPSDGSERHALKFGAQKINLHDAGAPFVPHAALPAPGSADLCFLSDAPLQDWLTHLELQGVSVEQGPVPRTGATGALISLYVRDPDGNLIEISNRG